MASETLAQLRQANSEARDAAKNGGNITEEELAELPEGAAPLETRKKVEEAAEETTESAQAAGAEPTEEVTEPAEEETLIRIGEREFTSEKEALRYAEQLEREKSQLEAYNQGIRDSLGSQGVVPEPEPEENFDEEFFKSPKEAIQKFKEQAKAEAVALIKAEQTREMLWNQFSSEYPEVRRKDAERVLAENMDVLGKMTDTKKAMQALAGKVRAEYAEIEELRKPRTEVPAKKGAQTARSGGTATSVTPQKKEDAPLDFISQLKTMKR